RPLDRNSAAGIPSREAHKSVKDRKGKKEHTGVKPAHSAVVSDEIKKQLAKDEPCKQIKSEPARMSKDGMHGLPALHLNAAEDRRSANDNCLHRAIRTRH